MTAQLVVGTAGHIDHGKSSLVRNLTGVDPDRLKEEKARGITIELGFAHIDLPSGQRLGLVDVPGHEKFVRHMVAGASGIDLVMLVIAADESIMPQTREHLEILTLLGLKFGLVVLNKCDLCDESWLALVEEEVKDFLKGSFLEQCPIIRFSSVTSAGRDDLLATLESLSRSLEKTPRGAIFRLPLDRAFSKSGFGTVVTGTALSGRVETGDFLSLYPDDHEVKVRGIGVHGQNLDSAVAGQRIALNISGLEKSKIRRGQVLAPVSSLKPSLRHDVWLRYLSSNPGPLKNRTMVRYHLGTSEYQGRVLLLETEELAPGQEGPAQMVLESEAVGLAGDHFVLRGLSPARTIAGGILLHPKPARHKRFQPKICADLLSVKEGEDRECLLALARLGGLSDLSLKALPGLIDWPVKKIKSHWDNLLSLGEIVIFDRGENHRAVTRAGLNDLTAHLESLLGDYHKQYPLRPGYNKEELKTRLPALKDPKLLNFVLDHGQKNNLFAVEQDLVRLASHQPDLQADLEKIETAILKDLASPMPPSFKEISGKLPGLAQRQKEVWTHLVKTGRIVRLNEDLYYSQNVLGDLWAEAENMMRQKGSMTAAEFKEKTGLNRKYLIAILEHFDQKNLTIRVGEGRMLRKS